MVRIHTTAKQEMISLIKVGDLVQIRRSASGELVGDVLLDEEEYYDADFGIVTHILNDVSPHGQWLQGVATKIDEPIDHEDFAEITIWSSLFGRLETYLCGSTILGTGLKFQWDRITKL